MGRGHAQVERHRKKARLVVAEARRAQRARRVFASRNPNPEIGTLFRSADSLHANFYDDQYERRQLEDGLADAKKLIALLDDADAAVPQDAPLPHGLRRLIPGTARRSRSRGA